MKFLRLKRLNIIGITMLIIVLPFGFYYLFFVSSQTNYFSKRNFRVLAEIGEHIAGKTETLATNLVNVAKKTAQDKKDKTKDKNTETDSEMVSNASKIVPDFKADPVQYEPGPHAGSPEGPVIMGVNFSGVSCCGRGTEKGSFWLQLEYVSNSSELPGKFSARKDLSKLFEPFISRYVIDELNETKEKLFDEVLVAEQETGRVIFEGESSGLKVATLDGLLNDKGGKLDLKLAEQSSSLADVQLAGANYKLFLQPVRLPLPTGTDKNLKEVNWIVCGLTRTDHFRDATFAAPYTVLIFFVFVVLLAVLGWPMLRLRLMGPKDRLKRADLLLTLFSALMGTALVTFILFDVYIYSSLEATLDRHLKNLSDEIKTNFETELTSALTQLGKLNVAVMDAAKKEEADAALKDLAASNNSNPKASSKVDPTHSPKTNILNPGVLPGVDWDYPYFNSATWTDENGRQRIKWTTRSETTAYLDVSEREYFKNIRDHKYWRLNPSSGFDYSLEVVKTKNTGESTPVIAASVPGSQWVSSIDTKLLSLMGPVLPAGYGYVVVDSTGKVLFHSDEVKNLEEQFLAECGNDRWLRAAVLLRVDRAMDANYLGKGHRMYVSSLSGTPWTLVTFADKQMARTINLEVITLSMALYILFALSIGALISGFLLIRMIVLSGRCLPEARAWTTRLWPDPKHASRYGWVIVSYLVIAIIFVASLIAGGYSLVICIGLLPLVALVIWWLILTRDSDKRRVEQKEGKQASRLSYRTRYAMAFSGLVMLMSALPAAGFFQIAKESELKLMVKHGQVSIAKALEQRTQRVKSQFVSDKEAFRDNRLESNLDVYSSFFFGATRSGLPEVQFAETPGLLDRLLLEIRPLYNQRCVESQGLAAAASSDSLWRWKTDKEGRRILLLKDEDGRNGDLSVALMSATAAPEFPDRIGSWIGVIALLLLPFLLYGLVRFVLRRFFLLDTDLPASVDFHDAKSSRSHVLVWSPMTANGDAWEGDRVFDFSRVTDWPDWSKTLPAREQTFKELKHRVVLSHFDHYMNDPIANREKLLTIEHFLKFEMTVVVVSTVDPLNCSLAPKRVLKDADKNGAGESASKPDVIKTKQNGAANSKIEYDGSAPSSIEKKDDDDEVNPPEFYLPPDIRARWTALFTGWETIYAADTQTDKVGRNHDDFLAILKTESPWRYIVEIGKVLGKKGKLPEKMCHDRAKINEVISQVVEQGRSYHQSVWESCSEGQRCTLINLAQDGMLSPKNKHLRLLVKRGLVVRDPGLRLMDESFRRFVISVACHEDVEGWRQQEGGSAWELMKAPLLIILLSVALFLFFTQKDLYDSSLSFMSAVTAGIAALFRLVGLFHKNRDGGSAIQI